MEKLFEEPINFMMLLVTLTSIIAPIIVSIINNRYQLRFKKIEIIEVNMRTDKLDLSKVFTDYLENVTELIAMSEAYHGLNMTHYSKYRNSHLQTLLYIDGDTKETVVEIFDLIESDKYQEALLMLNTIPPKFSKYLK